MSVEMHNYLTYDVLRRAETKRVIRAETAFVARRWLAANLNADVTDIVALRVDENGKPIEFA